MLVESVYVIQMMIKFLSLNIDPRVNNIIPCMISCIWQRIPAIVANMSLKGVIGGNASVRLFC